MPIKGRTDSHQEGRGIPILARIYKGAARDPNNERKTPAELPYFRVEWQPEAQKYAATFEALYGAQPTQFEGALLMGDTPERAFDNWMEQCFSTLDGFKVNEAHPILQRRSVMK